MSCYRICVVLVTVMPAWGAQRATVVLNPDSFRHDVEAFNRDDGESTTSFIDNKSA
jgi:hypothetical protein